MKKLFLKPGFEFIFALSIITILGLPPLVFAQTTKDLQITIQNGDTTVNGKNIKDMPVKERKEALKDINNINNSGQVNADIKIDGPVDKQVIVKSGNGDMVITTDSMGNQPMAAKSGKMVRIRRRKMMNRDSTFSFSYRMNSDPGKPMVREFSFNRDNGDAMMGFDPRNTQNFNYTSTDKDGVSTHISYRVSEPSPENLKRVGHFEGEMLDIKDLNLVPQFEAGKTMLMFSLPSKATAEVQFKDSDGNVLWTEKTSSGDFTKSFTLGLNGIYYLQVTQGGKIAVKKIFKE